MMSLLERIKKHWLPSPEEEFSEWYKYFGRNYPEGPTDEQTIQ